MGFSSSQIAQAAVISQASGAATSAVGSFFSAKSQASALQYQAGIADINARMSESAAQSALNQGQQQAGALTLKSGQLKSSQRVALAANGVDLGVGNAAEVQASGDIMKEIDKNTIEANAVRSAWGYRTQSVNSQNDALSKRTAAGGISPFSSGASTLLGGAGKVASSWYQLNKVGGLGGGTSFGVKLDGFYQGSGTGGD